ncbi:MAG: DNA-processing protein DprA [Candidatus Nanopelagicaceae bacterium]
MIDKELIARAQLFASVEAGTTFWAKEVFEKGAIKVVELCQEGQYKGVVNYDFKQFLNTNGEAVIEKITALGLELVIPNEKFEELPAPPIALICRGNSKLLERRSISIVGTRNPSPYGVRVASEMAANFVDREWVVVSGGAYGIDTAAHKGALIAEGETIAVLASGLDILYPAGNAKLFTEIAETGLLISEYMPGMKALPHRFLNRNRLIAALSKGTMVVEAAFRSGSLRTARDAHELNRIVMAIPGPITSPLSEGAHRLIGEGSAAICCGVNDAVELMGE